MAGFKKKGISLEAKKARMGWFFVAPLVLGFFLFFLGIIYNSLKFSFMDVQTDPAQGILLRNIKFENYSYMLTVDTDFVRNLRNSVRDMLYNIPITIMFSLFVAILLNGKMKGRGLFRAIFFIPVILATGIIDKADAMNSVLNAYQGIDVGESMSAAFEMDSLFNTASLTYYFSGILSFSPALTSMTVSVASNIYQVVSSSGVQILIFLAGLQGISPSLYEAAQIEGCSRWECFWKITFPIISPLILTNVVYTVVDSFTNESNVIMNTISTFLSRAEYGKASATAWMYFLVIGLLMAVAGMVVKSFVFYQNRE
ncbi:ABC-type sugar transport system permease subunit [Anaerotaenia torta]|uniref:carbohydrate ABC transporter permease n=1 Tax=Anaerotaenia torta TaxID=433293 RepID=UPI003D1B2264